MNTRQIEILKIIRDRTESISVAELSVHFQVSQRTIQKDLNVIDEELIQYHIGSIYLNSQKGCYLEKNAQIIQKIDQLIYKFNPYSTILSFKERQEVMFLLLALKQGYSTVSVLAEKLGISRNTVMADLKKIRNDLEEDYIQIASSSRYGIILNGDEKKIRERLVNGYLEHADSRCMLSSDKYYLASICNYFCKFWSKEESEVIYSSVHNLVKTLNNHYTESSFFFIITYIEFALARIKLGKTVAVSMLTLENIRATAEFEIMSSVMQKLGEILGFYIPIEEVAHLSYVLHNGGRVTVDLQDDNNYADFQWIVYKLVDHIAEYLHISLPKDTPTFQNLIFHIRPAIYRLQNGIKLKNPLLDEIKTDFKTVYEAVKENIDILEETFSQKITEDEIGYIAMHFIPLLEEDACQNNPYPNVVVVCDSGIGTSYLLATRLNSFYEVNVVKTIALYELRQTLSYYQVDIIVTTVELHMAEGGYNIIKVSPFLTNEDAVKLDSKLNRRQYSQKIDEEEFLKIIRRNGSIRDEKELLIQLQQHFGLKFTKKRKKDGVLLLKDVVRDGMIELDYEAQDWEQAVREAGRLLKKAGCIGEEYIQSMIDTVKTVGTYIVVSKGIALPHSRSGKDAVRVGISILRLKSPVEFGHPENDPVDLIFALSSVDSTSHLDALRDLAQMLNDAENIAFLRRAETAEEIYCFLQERREES